MISNQVRISIKGFLEGFIDGLVLQHKPPEKPPHLLKELDGDYGENEPTDGSYKPFHEAIIPEQVLRVSTFERSFSTKLGSTFEECARLIASQKYKVSKRGFIATGQMPSAATTKIEELVNQIAREHKPNFLQLIDEVLKIEDDIWVERPVVSDLYLEDKSGVRYFFEIKSPKPNKGQCLEIAERLLRIHAITQENRPRVNAYFAMAYNPYGLKKEDYKHSFSLQYLDMKNEVLLGDEFWETIGGKGTFAELLEIYQEVGREKTKAMMDALLFGF
ncbi:MAG: TdeIII family type II restriction endonuclease [Anaerolineae bacterium]|nr:TdeIII family type II restriction endonuclease [Anaerolineae bacterium]